MATFSFSRPNALIFLIVSLPSISQSYGKIGMELVRKYRDSCSMYVSEGQIDKEPGITKCTS